MGMGCRVCSSAWLLPLAAITQTGALPLTRLPKGSWDPCPARGALGLQSVKQQLLERRTDSELLIYF